MYCSDSLREAHRLISTQQAFAMLHWRPMYAGFTCEMRHTETTFVYSAFVYSAATTDPVERGQPTKLCRYIKCDAATHGFCKLGCRIRLWNCCASNSSVQINSNGFKCTLLAVRAYLTVRAVLPVCRRTRGVHISLSSPPSLSTVAFLSLSYLSGGNMYVHISHMSSSQRAAAAAARALTAASAKPSTSIITTTAAAATTTTTTAAAAPRAARQL